MVSEGNVLTLGAVSSSSLLFCAGRRGKIAARDGVAVIARMPVGAAQVAARDILARALGFGDGGAVLMPSVAHAYKRCDRD